MDQIQRVIDNLINGNLSDVREIFKALPSQEAAWLSASVVAQMSGEDGPGLVETLIKILAD